MSRRGQTLVKGHTLKAEGAPYDNTGKYRQDTLGRVYWGTTGIGCAVCSCGAISPTLDTAAERKRWHAEHKQQIREATA